MGWEVQDRGDMCTHIADSLCCTTEMEAVVLQLKKKIMIMCLENVIILRSLTQATVPCSAVKSRAMVMGTILCLFARCHVSVVIFATVRVHAL